jgi:hypothetical protein
MASGSVARAPRGLLAQRREPRAQGRLQRVAVTPSGSAKYDAELLLGVVPAHVGEKRHEVGRAGPRRRRSGRGDRAQRAQDGREAVPHLRRHPQRVGVVPSRILRSSACALGPSKGRRPVARVEHRARGEDVGAGVDRVPSICSGAMWAGEPSTWPGGGHLALVGDVGDAEVRELQLRPGWSMRLSGFTSRWITPCACARESASQSTTPMAATTSAGTSGCARRSAAAWALQQLGDHVARLSASSENS